ncbi:MAG: DUF1311 domain-containing protein [Gammaproteobacteria bacterium]|nr:DUF1311 domain-containing protein [Gammaproteobacteria bacterium]
MTVAGTLYLLSSLSTVAWAVDPSFDCAKASHTVEHVICKSERLSRQDMKLSSLYRKLMGQAVDESAQDLKSRQLDWLLKRNQSCSLDFKQAEACLLELYRKRNAELSSMLAFDSADVARASGLKILRVTPQGDDVQAGQQIVFQFDRPVVPIGRMERESSDIPVAITPALNCEWRWLNTSALACQLRQEDKMKQATSYDVIMKPGISTEDGAQLWDEYAHSFTTARPKVTYSRFVNWLSPGTPMIQVTFNQPVTKSSLEAAITMQQKSAYGAEVVGVIAYPDNMPRTLPWWMALTNETEQPLVNDQLASIDGEEARKAWVVEARQELPLDTKMSLVVSPGLKSSEGGEVGVEQRTVVTFDTYPEFRFLGITCTPKGQGAERLLTFESMLPSDNEDYIETRCAPLRRIALVFSAPVLNSMVKNHIEFEPRLNGGRKDYDPWENVSDWSHLRYAHRKGRDYNVWLPELLQAYKKYSIRVDTEHLRDEFNRPLESQIAFDFFTAHREPNLRLNHRVAVLEKGVDSDVPLYVTNLNEVTVNYDKLGDEAEKRGLKREIEIEQAEDIAYAVPLGVRELLGVDDSGMVFGRLHPDPVPPNWYRDPEVLAQVTPYQVHFKAGHFNSQVWVTKFSDGKSVAGARVSLLKGSYESISSLVKLDVNAVTDADGVAMLPGLEQFDPDLDLINGGYNHGRQGFFARVEYGGDIAVLPLSGHFSVNSSGIYSWLRKKGGHTHAWGTTAQGIYKLGDTIQFKIYVRNQSNKHWVSPAKSSYELQVIDPQNKVVYGKNGIELNDFGAFDGEFKVPQQAAVGWYRFKLQPAITLDNASRKLSWTPMSVLVSDFTPSPFKVKTELNGEVFRANDRVEVSSLATLHSGGPFSDAEVRLTAKLKIKDFTTENPVAKGFTFGASATRYLGSAQSNLLDIRGKLDDFGQYEDAFTLPETGIYFGSVMVESAVKDDRGKFVASSSSADYAGRDRFVGLRNTSWIYEKGKPARLETLVVDQHGILVPDVDVSIAINHREFKASRVKGPGNAYLTKNIMAWVAETSCEISSVDAAATCEFRPEHPGYYQFVASIKDSRNREHKTTLHGWVTGRGNVVWDQADDASLQIVPEQTSYQIGQTARYLVKNPYPGATALITVERYGILESWTQILETGTPIIEVPIKPEYLPGFYLSVVALSPRVDMPLSPDKVDLGKPTYRMGYVAAKVSDPYKELEISVTTDQEVYKPRDRVKAQIQIQAKPAQGARDENFEIAVAVIDESVLALNRHGDNYYDPYAGFNRLDSLDVMNYSLISRLVGRQKFEKKGANPGGGGSGNSKLRNLFKFVSYWNPGISPDTDGRAEIEFEVPDNLTGWRIFAFAVTRDDRMGLGDVNFKVNRPTEIRPVMPNQVVEGDQFKAGFSVMNRSDQLRRLKVDVSVAGPLTPDQQTSFSFDLDIAAFKRESVWVPIKTQGDGKLSFKIDGKDQLDGDAVVHSLPVNKRRSLEVGATNGTTTADSTEVSVEVPHGIHTDVGYIGAALSPSVIGNLDGAFRYVRDYPYLCWEQRLTRAILANSYVELEEYLDEETRWPEPQQDVDQTLSAAANFQAPNGGMVYWIPFNSHVSPYLSAYTAMGFNWLRKSGHPVPTQVEERLHGYLQGLLRRDEFPTFYSRGMASSVRAVALAALSEAGRIGSGDVARHETHLPEMDLFGKSHFLQAAIKTEGVSDSTVKSTLDSILGHASQSGGKFQFNEAWDDSYRYLLATPMRSNCSILSSLLAAQTESAGAASIGDIPFKLVRSITQGRGNREHWENTQENVFCLNALIDYASIYEADEPAMDVVVKFNDESIGSTRFSAKADQLVMLSRDMRDADEGLSAKLEIDRKGRGRLYYSARIAYDLKQENASRINSGIEIRREYSVERDGKFVLLQSPMGVRRGDVVKVDLFVSLPTARHFVVVDDPIPGGLEPVNTDLATASQVDADKGAFKVAEDSWFYNFSDWSYYGRYFWSFYHKELRHDSARFYADYLPAGNYHLSYTSQAIAEGNFAVMAVNAEEMYDPDVYGKGLPATLVVNQ